MSNVLITGVAGLLGSHLADRLLELGHRVVGIDNLAGGDLANVPEGVEFFRADCCDVGNPWMFGGVDVVYHLAAAPQEGLSYFSPCFITKNTFNSTIAVATGAINAGVRRFVFTSSTARYGCGQVPFTEDMPTNPVDPYGIAKVAAEQVLTCLSSLHGMELVIAVPHNIIGPRQRIDPFRNVATIMATLMLDGRQPYIYGDGQQKRCFSWVGDCVESLVRMMSSECSTYNIGPDEEFITINCLAEMLAEIIGFDLSPVYVEARKEVKFSYSSSAKARKYLGYQTTKNTMESLVELVAWLRINRKPFEYHLPIEIQSQLPNTWRARIF